MTLETIDWNKYRLNDEVEFNYGTSRKYIGSGEDYSKELEDDYTGTQKPVEEQACRAA